MLKEKLSADLKDAMRAKDQVRLRTIRSLRAALMEKEIEQREGGIATLTAEQEMGVVQKQAKQRRDSIDQYEKAGRDDLRLKEAEELAVIEEYLPKQLGDDELRKVVQEVIAATGASSPKDIGRVMGAAMERVRGQAEGRRVQQMASELLSR
ncbi:MAG: GatB/YqeY domain-containing protein [Rhodothermales bacterium]